MTADPRAALLQQLLAERAGDDPRMQALLQMMSSPPEEPAVPSPDAEQRKVRLRRRIAELLAELEALRERNDDLADALGACARCWGDDRECPECGGDGGAGWMIPRASPFRALVAPAIERLQTDPTSNNQPPQRRTE